MPVVYYVQSWTVHRLDLSSAPAANFVDAVDLINAAEFDTVPSRHSSTVSSSLGQSIVQVSSSRQHTDALLLHAADFHYRHAGCHLIATVQQYFRQPTA